MWSTFGSRTSESIQDPGSDGSISPLDLGPDVNAWSSMQVYEPSVLPARRYTAASCFDYGLDLPWKPIMSQRSKSLGILPGVYPMDQGDDSYHDTSTPLVPERR